MVNVFAVFLCLMFSMTATTVTGDSLDSDSQVLLSFKSYLKSWKLKWMGNREARCVSMIWDHMCTSKGSKVTGINLRGSTISDPPFSNFSALTLLTFFNLSSNTIQTTWVVATTWSIWIFLIISLEGILAYRVYRILRFLIFRWIKFLVMFALASHCYATAWFLQIYRPSGIIDDIFNECRYLKYVDLRYNRFSGVILGGWSSFQFMGIVSPVISQLPTTLCKCWICLEAVLLGSFRAKFRIVRIWRCWKHSSWDRIHIISQRFALGE